MRKSLRQRLAEEKRGKFEGVVMNEPEDLYKLLVDGERPPEERHANPTQLAFWHDPAFAKSYGGPAGCAKTSTVVAEAIIRGMFEAGSKMLIARNDYNDLKDTTKLRFDEMIARLPPGTVVDKNDTAPAKVWIQPVKTGKDAPDALTEFTFMGLKGGLGSYEFTGAVIDEADECEQHTVDEVRTRLRHRKGTRYLGVAFNPPDKNHWLYTACTGKDARDEYVQEPVFSHHRPNPRENMRNLPDDYYDKMAALSEDMRMRLRDGEWGTTFPGDPVYRQFSKRTHTARLSFKGGTLFRFWDFGYNRPYCCWGQVSLKGHVQILHEFLGFQLSGKALIAEVLKQTAMVFPGAKVFRDFGDPAVKQVKDTGSMLKLLLDEGIKIGFQHTPFDVSLKVMRQKFETLIDGDPAILIDSRNCPVLIGAMSGGYHLDKDGVTPKKDGYYDHPADALRYGVWNLFGVGQTTHSTVPLNVAYWSKR
jgi:Phage terminase large subunit